jgi:GT2 family glycosyltransferase
LRRLIEVLQSRPDAAVVGPLLRRPDGQIEHSVHRFPSVTLLAVANLVPQWLPPRVVRDRLWLPGAVRPERTCAVDWVVGAVHVLRRDALPADGPYRERWFMYAEDVDLCWRLRQRGWQTVFVGDAEVVHVGGASARQVADRTGAPPWTAATYDWYRLAFGRRRARLFATLNLLGELRLLLARLGRAMIDRSARTRTREQLRAGLELARRHLAVAAGRDERGSLLDPS